MSENIREIVFDCLMLIDEEERKSHLVLREVLDKYDYLDERDKNFIKRLTEGTIQWRITLDYVLDSVSDRPMAKCKAEVREILRMGAYQLLYMDRVPESAAIDEAVKLTKKRSRSEFSGFVNAILRKVATKGTCALVSIEDPVTALSVEYSLPEWMVRMFLKEQDDAEELIKELVKERPTVVRIVMPEKTQEILDKWTRAVIKHTPTGKVDNTYTVEGFHGTDGLYGFNEGLIYIQDLSSMFSVSEGVKGMREGHLRALDLCAAPGGKSVFLSGLKGSDVAITACDVSEDKVSLIEENVARLGLDNITAMVNDASVYREEFECAFDLVIADVPCSGLGVISRKSDLKYRVTNESMISLCALQKDIMDAAVKYVKKGGRLIYSTCTIHRAENEKMVKYIEKISDLKCIMFKQLRPDKDGTDGFFVAVFERE